MLFSDGTITVALQKTSNDTFSAQQWRDYHSGTSKIIKWHFFGKTVTLTITVARQKPSMTLFRKNSDADYQSGTSKLQQKFNNRQNIQEKNEIDHNFNIDLPILNITNFYNISFFWLSSLWWSKSSKVMCLIKKQHVCFKLHILKN